MMGFPLWTFVSFVVNKKQTSRQMRVRIGIELCDHAAGHQTAFVFWNDDFVGAGIAHRLGVSRYAQAMRNSGADEVIIPEYEGGLMTGRMIAKFYPDAHSHLA